jgi:hypothetical protein
MSPFEHPKVRAAIEKESEARDIAFLALPFDVEGQKLLPFTLTHYLRLQLAKNAFVCGGEALASDAAMFLYVVTDQKGPAEEYAMGVAHLDFLKVCEGVSAYLKEAFFDAPPGAGSGFSRSYFSIASTLADVMGREYGWNYWETMDAPVSVLFQMLRVAAHRANPDVPLFNPLSDRALMEAAG